MEISVSELAEYAEHVRKVERNGKVTVTNNYNEGKIAALERELASSRAALRTVKNAFDASERDAQTREETITQLRDQLSTYHSPESWADLMTRYNQAQADLNQARDFNATCNPGPEAPADRTASAFRAAVIERTANGARDGVTAAMDVYILWGLDRLAAYESAVRPVGQAKS